MAESFENLDNVLRDWAKDKGQKSLAEVLNRFEKQGEERLSRCFLKIIQKKFSSRVSVGSQARLNQTQNWSW